MAKRLEGKSDELIRCAQNEFMEMGFQDASMRVIAAKAGVSTGAIYTRFGDKAGLFHAIVDDAVNQLVEWFLQAQKTFDERTVEEKADVLDYAKDKFLGMVDDLYDNYDVFRMILRCTDIDCYDQLLSRLVEIDNEYTLRYMRSTNHDAIASGRLSPEMLHILASAYYASLFETIRHEMPREKAYAYARQLRRFFSAGWADILEIKPDDG